jgi:hypothetical protein
MRYAMNPTPDGRCRCGAQSLLLVSLFCDHRVGLELGGDRITNLKENLWLRMQH